MKGVRTETRIRGKVASKTEREVLKKDGAQSRERVRKKGTKGKNIRDAE